MVALAEVYSSQLLDKQPLSGLGNDLRVGCFDGAGVLWYVSTFAKLHSLILNSSAVLCGILATAFLFIVSCFFALSFVVSPVASELKATIH